MPALGLSLDFEWYSPCVRERQMVLEHLDTLSANDLLVLDRGYQDAVSFPTPQSQAPNATNPTCITVNKGFA